VPYLPVGVHLAVVDPGVGTARRPIAILCARGDVLVGPDNGLLSLAAERLGGIVAALLLDNPALWRPQVSSTFHGRDLFAPVAAHLAAGVPYTKVGSPLDPADVVSLDLPEPMRREDGIDTSVLFVDTFGNCRLAGSSADLGRGSPPQPGRRFRAVLPQREIDLTWVPTFGEVRPGDPLLYEDADYAGLALAINQGSAADAFGLTLDSPVLIRRA
ncbi:MAG: SAM hydrolase/SAM-dependent halogenase family protein, partial [Candidatus Limnocylindria bacterium]